MKIFNHEPCEPSRTEVTGFILTRRRKGAEPGVVNMKHGLSRIEEDYRGGREE